MPRSKHSEGVAEKDREGADLDRRAFLRMTSAATITLATAPLACAGLGGRERAPLVFEAYRRLDAVALAELVRKGDADPAELLEIAIARADAIDPAINAITVRHFERARDAVRQGLPDGPLRGVPYLLKDLGIQLAGTVTTEGSRLFADAFHETSSTLADRYEAAGLAIFAKTHSPEFGSSPSSESTLHGATRNPWDLARSAGGSSGGSAAAVAAGIVPAAHATDGGGSIRIPASACGLFGLKPSRGRVPLGPRIYEGWGGLSAAHAVTRSVRDSAALLDATQGPAVGDAYAAPPRERPYLEEIERDPGRLRIALMREPLLPVPVAPECVDAVHDAGRLCAGLGHDVVPAKPDLDALALWGAYGPAVSVGVAQKVADREAVLGRPAERDELEPLNWRTVEEGRRQNAIDFARARRTFHAASRALGRFHETWDLVMSPTMALVPPPIGSLALDQPYERFIGPASAASCFTALFNMTGQPAMSVPLYWTAEGIPIGVMFAARLGDEATLFRLAAQLEAERPWFDRVARI